MTLHEQTETYSFGVRRNGFLSDGRLKHGRGCHVPERNMRIGLSTSPHLGTSSLSHILGGGVMATVSFPFEPLLENSQYMGQVISPQSQLLIALESSGPALAWL